MNGVATLVDSNVILDVFTEDERWFEWSSEALDAASDRGPLVINPIIYAEVSVRFTRIEDLEDALDPRDFRRDALPWDAGFLAAKAFGVYRASGGRRTTTLPDFFVGAHAAVRRLQLLTRDAARYRTYFPTVPVTSPS